MGADEVNFSEGCNGSSGTGKDGLSPSGSKSGARVYRGSPGTWEVSLSPASYSGWVHRRPRTRPIVGMVHHVLLSGVRRASPGTAVGRYPGRRLDVAELSRNTSLHTPYHTWLLLPRHVWHHAIPALPVVHKRRLGTAGARTMPESVIASTNPLHHWQQGQLISATE